MRSLLIGVVLFAFVACKPGADKSPVGIIPLPQSVVETGVQLRWQNTDAIHISYDSSFFQPVAKQMCQLLTSNYQMNCMLTQKRVSANVAFVYKAFENQEKYRLQISDSRVVVEAASASAAFFGFQSLKQLLPLKNEFDGQSISLPGVLIEDEPANAYRGVHLDVARHFFTADSIKRFIDMLALHKINTFHWHLTDDQGWRLEIKKYPKLTQVGACRERTVIGRNSPDYDEQPHGGYYTQDEVRDIVGYAAERYITVIPEIDMPGHMVAALTAYPELGCQNKQLKVADKWGVFEDVLCVGKEESYEFIYCVLDEVMDLFPSKYIHIGGDECPKTRWESCKHCQKEIKALGFKSDDHFTAEQKLQSYFTRKVENHLNKNGRYLIGWDEILEGGVSPTATVMAWRGVGHGLKAAQLGNKVVLSPNTHVYFDYYQTKDILNEPLAIGGSTTLEMVYNWDPFEKVESPEAKGNIIGLQANIWTEYIKTFKHVEYMLLPRLAAFSEVAWSSADKDYDAFQQRLERMLLVYDAAGYNYAKHIFDIKKECLRDTVENTMALQLSTYGSGEIRFTTDGSTPDRNSQLYTGPIAIDQSMVVKAIAYHGEHASRVLEQSFSFNKATLKPIQLNTPAYHDYAFNGALLLNDGLTGQKNYKSGYWLGYNNEDLSVTIDLKQETPIQSIALNAFVSTADWIFRPTYIEVHFSDDNETYHFTKSVSLDKCTSNVFEIENYTINFKKYNTRFVKIIVGSNRNIPEWHPAKGKPAFIFVDEIEIH
ncbi:beta-N-acetylhexosaminidase [Carboxylicivirga taeanensis]|uniref:beta-N-acetylhexosaminidase n=1 Tax=Carboxylicivirga taeanensis TaxID=1416875 RepID=UPI003F6E1FA6